MVCAAANISARPEPTSSERTRVRAAGALLNGVRGVLNDRTKPHPTTGGITMRTVYASRGALSVWIAAALLAGAAPFPEPVEGSG